ncbi:DNA invertase [Pseudomonas aeruginosa]|nr:DNA invertase [Pseudomonas aeruginosa]
MKIGYARVSTRDQKADLQVDALKQAGCERIYQDIASGAKSARPELDKLLANVRPGDAVVIWKLDRLGRSLKHLVELVGELAERKVGLQSLNDPIDTTHAQRPPGVQPVRLAGRVRARADPRADSGGPVGRTVAGPDRWPSQGSARQGRGHRHGGANAVPRGSPERQRHRREATHLQEHTVQLPAPPGCRDRRIPEERPVTRSADHGLVVIAGRAARCRAGGHRHPAPGGGE